MHMTNIPYFLVYSDRCGLAIKRAKVILGGLHEGWLSYTLVVCLYFEMDGDFRDSLHERVRFAHLYETFTQLTSSSWRLANSFNTLSILLSEIILFLSNFAIKALSESSGALSSSLRIWRQKNNVIILFTLSRKNHGAHTTYNKLFMLLE